MVKKIQQPLEYSGNEEENRDDGISETNSQGDRGEQTSDLKLSLQLETRWSSGRNTTPNWFFRAWRQRVQRGRDRSYLSTSIGDTMQN